MQPQPTAGYPPHSYAYGGYPTQQQPNIATVPPSVPTAPVSVAMHQYPATMAAPHPGAIAYNNQQAWTIPQQAPHPSAAPVQQQPVYAHHNHQHHHHQPQQHSAPQQYGGFTTASPAPGYGHHFAPPAPPPPALPAAPVPASAPPPLQDQQQQQQAVCLPLQAAPLQPLPAGPGQNLSAYAYPGTGAVAATVQEQQQQQQQYPDQQPQQQQEEQQSNQQLSTPQQVAQQAIAKTLASMQQQQNQSLAFDNRRGYLHGNLIGKMEKARLERAAEKNEKYVRRKDEIARRKRLGLPLDGLIDPKKLLADAAGDGAAGAGKPKPPPRPPVAAGGGQNRAGIGTVGARVPNASVYITGLPRDVIQAKIELVFSQHGKVKRVKLYRDEAGQAKGDGLVTYAKPLSADLAVVKLNGHEITPGYPIIVSMADFTRTKAGAPEEEQQEAWPEEEAVQDSAPAAVEEEVWDADGVPPPLPAECGADKHPVVVLRNVYTREEAEADPNFYDDLEADMLMECVKFGTVVRVATPETPGYYGSVCVTFDASSGADACAGAMHGRWFDQRQIEAIVMGAQVIGKEEEDKCTAGTMARKDVLGETAKAYQDVPSREDSPPPSDLNSFLASVS